MCLSTAQWRRRSVSHISESITVVPPRRGERGREGKGSCSRRRRRRSCTHFCRVGGTTGNKCSFELERDREREERGSLLEHICSNVNMDYGGGAAQIPQEFPQCARPLSLSVREFPPLLRLVESFPEKRLQVSTFLCASKCYMCPVL